MSSSRSAELPLSSVKAKMDLRVEGPVARPCLSRRRSVAGALRVGRSTELEAHEGHLVLKDGI